MKNTEVYNTYGIKPKTLKNREDVSSESSRKGRGVRKMVSSKKANTGGGSGPSTPPRRNGRLATSGVFHEHNVYVTTKVNITPGSDVPTELPKGYHKFLLKLKEIN